MTELLPIILFSLSSSFTPGPNNFLIMNSGLQFGIRRSLPHYLGICFGFPMMLLLIALGLGSIFAKYLWLKEGLKVIGSLYMLYMAWQILRSSKNTKTVHAAQPFSFMQALLFQWVNPKAWLMAIGAISIFTLSQNYLLNAIALSAIFFITILPCTGAWLVLGNYLQTILKKDIHRVWFNIVMALSLAASIILIFLD